jgi:hypothetical protein
MEIRMNYVLARLAEPSTYASLAAILGGIGYVLPAGVIQNLTLAGMIGAGLVGVFLKEGVKALTDGDAAKAIQTAVAADK